MTSAIAGALAIDGETDADLERLQIPALGVSGRGEGVLAQGRARLIDPSAVVDGIEDLAQAELTPGRAVLRRDAIGVRSLFYACSPDRRRFAFASTPAQLERLPWVDRSIDVDGLLDTLCPTLTDVTDDEGSRTCVVGVRQVPPGHRLEWRGGAINLVREWCAERFVWRGGRAPRHAAGEFADLLVAAVSRRWRPETAILLSGGLDSTSVAAAAVRAGHHPRTLSAVYPELPSVDESPRIGATLDALSLTGASVIVRDRGLDTIDEELDVHAHPTGAANYSNFSALLAEAANRGLVSLLDGHDGDTSLGSMHGVAAHLLTRPRLALSVLRAARTRGGGVAPLLRGWASELAPPVAHRLKAVVRQREGARDQIPLWIGEELRQRLLALSRLTWSEAQALVASPFVARAFPTLNRMAASHGIELAHPYADRELVEFLLGLPPEVKHAGGRPKALVRVGFPELPVTVREQGKTVFSESAEVATPFSRMARELRGMSVPVPGIDYQALDARLAEGPPFRPWEQSLMRWLAVSQRFLARRCGPTHASHAGPR